MGPRARRDVLVGYAFRMRGYCIWIPELNQIIESIDVTFDEKAKFDPESSGTMTGPEVGELFPRGIVNQNEQVVKVIPLAIPGPSNVSPDSRSSGREDTDSESDDEDCQSPAITSLQVVSWLRKPIPRPMGKRVDIYYFEKDKPDRLISLTEVERYHDRHQIRFVPNLFYFRGSNLYSDHVIQIVMILKVLSQII